MTLIGTLCRLQWPYTNLQEGKRLLCPTWQLSVRVIARHRPQFTRWLVWPISKRL